MVKIHSKQRPRHSQLMDLGNEFCPLGGVDTGSRACYIPWTSQTDFHQAQKVSQAARRHWLSGLLGSSAKLTSGGSRNILVFALFKGENWGPVKGISQSHTASEGRP